jgi:hypothetical protein
VEHVLVNGRVAFSKGEFDPAFGKERGFGSFLPAGDKVAAGARAERRAA